MATLYEEGAIVSNSKGDKLRLTNGEWVPEGEGVGEINKGLSSIAALGKGLLDFPSDVVRTGATLSAGMGDLMQGNMPDWAAARERFSAENNPVVGSLAAPGRLLQQGVESMGGNLEQSYLGELGQAIGDEVGQLSPAALTTLDVLGVGGGFVAPGAGRSVMSGAQRATDAVGDVVGGARNRLGMGAPSRMPERALANTGLVDDALPTQTGTGLSFPPRPGAVGRSQQMMAAGEGAAPTVDFLPGLMNPEELAVKYGITELSPGRAALVSGVKNKAQFDQIQAMMRQEDLTRGLPTNLGAAGQMQRMLDQTENAMTRGVLKELKLPQEQMITQRVLAKNLTAMGKQYDNLTERAGKVVIDDGVKQDMAMALDASTDVSRNIIERKIQTFSDLAEKHGGAIPAADFRAEIHNLGELIKNSKDWTKQAELENLKKALDEAVYNNLGAADKAAFQNLNRRYATTMTLLKPGVLERGTGRVNEGAFLNNWRGSRPSRIKRADQEDISRLAETLTFMNKNQAVPAKTSVRQWLGGAANQVTGGAIAP
jgi:hypothetical protein